MKLNILKMSETDLLERLESKARKADEIIQFLRKDISELQTILSHNKPELWKNELEEKTKSLEAQVESAKRELIRLELANGRRQVSLPNETTAASEVSSTADEKNKLVEAEKHVKNKSEIIKSARSAEEEKPVTKKAKEVKPKSTKGSSGDKPDKDKPIDVRRLDLRVGRILYVQRHPDANSLYIENIDVGEITSRVVVSGLVEHVSMWDLKNRSVVVLCNLKPAKMRGIVSEGMVMCASTHSAVELLNPPEGSVAGDLIEIDGYPRDPDKVIDARKSAYETIAEDLKTNSQGVATYKGAPWRVPGKGLVTVSTMTDSSIS